MKVLIFISFLIGSVFSYTCSDFVEGACELSEDNIVGHDRFTSTARDCQVKCIQTADCTWFTHLDTQCYLLRDCGQAEHCDGCASGPTQPDITNCPWPPSPTTNPPPTTTPQHPTTPGTTATAGCENFQEGTCELNENNIISFDRFTNSPAECQQKCQADAECHWFTHFDTSCYLLDHCGTISHCGTCVSGPQTPDISDCPWPPQPGSTTSTTPAPTTTAAPTTTTTTTTKVTTRVPIITTTKVTTRVPLVPTTAKITTRVPLDTTTTTPRPTQPTSTAGGNCNEIRVNENCDWNYGLLHWYENVMTGNQCQEQCRQVVGATYFSHYNEGAHGERGYCGCFSSCAWPSSEGCYSSCSTHQTHEISDLFSEPEPELDSSESFGGELDVELSDAGQPRPGPHYCHCMRGPLHPDIDDCGIWPDVF